MRAVVAACWLCGLAALLSIAAEAATLIGDPSNYVQKLHQLRPGDILTLVPGVYRDGLRIHGLRGESARRIVVMGQTRSERPLFVARPGQNTVSIANSSYVTLRDLVLDGINLPVDAVKAEGTSHHADYITLENVLIVGHGADQSIVGISTQCPARGWIIRGNEIVGAGTGMYLGGSAGNAPFVAGTIVRNRVVDTIGYNLQIKHQVERSSDDDPNVQQVTVIADNVFAKAKGGSQGSLARPNVLLGHFPASGAGSRDWYVVRGNLFYGNPHERLLQAEGRVRISSNVFVNLSGSAIALMPHKGDRVEALVDHNTVVARDEGVRLSGADGASQVFANLVYAAAPLVGVESGANATYPFQSAAAMLRNPMAAPPALDVTLRSEALLLFKAMPNGPARSAAAAAEAWRVTGGAPTTDFAGRARASMLPGAFDAGAPAPIALQPRQGPQKSAGQ